MDLLNQETRFKIIQDIKSEENQQRKAKSQKEYEVFKGVLHKYVVEYLKKQFLNSTVKEMPIISSINLAKKIVTNEASIYKSEPKRSISGVDESINDEIESLYQEMNVDSKMMKLNQIYKLQQQALLQVLPKSGKLELRCYYSHQYDVIPNAENPELADGYIISVFDKQNYNDSVQSISSLKSAPLMGSNDFRDSVNQKIADKDDYQAALERYVVWTKDYNFIMDGKGNMLSEDPTSPIADAGIMPFVDVAMDKDFEYFVRGNDGAVDFTIQYNGALSDIANVVKMQGWGQAYLKGDKDLMPESLVIGVNHVLRLPIDPNSKVETEFGFSTPNSNIEGSIKYIELLLSNYLSSKGLEASTISSNNSKVQSYSSGVERLLSQIEKFEASKADFALFRYVENKMFEIIKAWSYVLSSTGTLLNPLSEIPLDAKLNVKYEEPTMIQSIGEKTDLLIKQLDAGLKSKLQAIKELYEVDSIRASELLKEIDEQLELDPLNQGNINNVGTDKGIEAQ